MAMANAKLIPSTIGTKQRVLLLSEEREGASGQPVHVQRENREQHVTEWDTNSSGAVMAWTRKEAESTNERTRTSPKQSRSGMKNLPETEPKWNEMMADNLKYAALDNSCHRRTTRGSAAVAGASAAEQNRSCTSRNSRGEEGTLIWGLLV